MNRLYTSFSLKGISTPILTLLLSITLWACGGDQTSNNQQGNTASASSSTEAEPQLNISIFLDLSHRIDPQTHSLNPSQKDRDIAIISELVELFRSDMLSRKAHFAQGKFKVFIDPLPSNGNIDQMMRSLDINLEGMEASDKKKEYEQMAEKVSTTLEQIYNESIDGKNWVGSDIWGFFKRKAKRQCILPGHRNILVVLTDGYIYHENSVERQDNKYSYLLGKVFQEQGLRAGNALSTMDSKQFGLIAPVQDLTDLEVLFLELNPEPQHPQDIDLLEYSISKWLEEMGVKKYEIYKTDLPSNTARDIKRFLQAR